MQAQEWYQMVEQFIYALTRKFIKLHQEQIEILYNMFPWYCIADILNLKMYYCWV